MPISWTAIQALHEPDLERHWARCRDELTLDCPLAVFEELFFEHHGDDDFGGICHRMGSGSPGRGMTLTPYVYGSMICHDEFDAESFAELSEPVQEELLAQLGVLTELRFDVDGGVWRVAFAFGPHREAILLMAGD